MLVGGQKAPHRHSFTCMIHTVDRAAYISKYPLLSGIMEQEYMKVGHCRTCGVMSEQDDNGMCSQHASRVKKQVRARPRVIVSIPWPADRDPEPEFTWGCDDQREPEPLASDSKLEEENAALISMARCVKHLLDEGGYSSIKAEATLRQARELLRAALDEKPRST